MKHKPCLDLQDIKAIAQAAEAHATARGWAVSIAIADDGGHLLWLQR
ncbi:heme-binding protein, partial [Delftia tsuruhatensis]